MIDALGDVQSILVLGGTSDIGLAITRALIGPRHASVVLAGRDRRGLAAAADDLRSRGAGQVEILDFDATEYEVTSGSPHGAGEGGGSGAGGSGAGGSGGGSGAGGSGGGSSSGGSSSGGSSSGGSSSGGSSSGSSGGGSSGGGSSGGGGRHQVVVDRAVALIGDLDVVVLAFGLLGNQAEDEAGGAGAVRVAAVNYVGTVSVGLAVARQLKAQGHGIMIVLSSVAGERVRRSNFIYGSSKAGMDGFAQGLGDALVGSGARLLIVRPGFVTTKMTAGMAKVPLSTTADAVAAATVRGLRRGTEIVWVPSVLRWVMVAVRHLPRPVFRKLKV